MGERAGRPVVTEPSLLLKTDGLTRYFGGVAAVVDCSFGVAPGELVGLIGPNGAGKTTLFNLVAGALRPSRGEVYFRGQRITGMPAESVARLGLARTFQNIRLFRGMSVLDNLRAAYHLRHRYGWAALIAGHPSARAEEDRILESAVEHARLFGIAGYLDALAGELPYGVQKRVEIARALILDPDLLLLDEPAAGLNPRETGELFELISHIKAARNLTVLLIEHNMRFVMSICRRLIVMAKGQIIASGPPEAVREDPQVLEAYLGTRRRALRGEGRL